MGWKGVIRSMEVAQRRNHRALVSHARQSQRAAATARAALMNQRAAMAAAHEDARNRYEVQLFDNYLEFVKSMHVDSWNAWNWNDIVRLPQPQPMRERERAAVHALQTYQPSIAERALGRDNVMRSQLQKAIEIARHEDAVQHQQSVAQWEWYHRVANGVVSSDLQAYATVIDYLAPFDELESLGTTIRVRTEAPWYLEAFVVVRDEELIPDEELKLTATGKLSRKVMPKSKYWELYQDHVCSAAIRVARELFALLPIRTAFVHVGKGAVNKSTGHDEVATLMSARFDREPFLRLNFERLDPSDAVSTFEHRMKFKKTTGFTPTEPLTVGNSMVSS